jgi:uncharacterized repeat protein (TIGR03803 family)
MRAKRLFIGLRATLAILAVTLSVTSTCVAAEKKLHNFGINDRDGTSPDATLIFDAAGNLYGTTNVGGDYGDGTVFELTPKQGGGWTEKKLHNFYSYGYNGKDGANPIGGLIFDAAGNLYGTTELGGDYPCYGDYGCGTVFELMPTEGGGWTEKKLHNFGNGTDGTGPTAGLIFDAAGNLYGTTLNGGAYGVGTVFEMTPTEGGGWTERVLRSFGPPNGNGRDGFAPYAGLVFDAAGNLYGTTREGGTYGYGTVFELTPTEGGGWTEKKLHNFNYNGTDGFYPQTNLIFDVAGNLYGTTYEGGDYPCPSIDGTHGCGTVFEMTPSGGGWTEKKLHNFRNNGTDGTYPVSSLIFDGAGNLYGTTYYGGDYPCYYGLGCGTVFELTPAEGGGWTEQKLHNFGINSKDGIYPDGGLIFDAAGNLYGTTDNGGDYSGEFGAGDGTVFQITP